MNFLKKIFLSLLIVAPCAQIMSSENEEHERWVAVRVKTQNENTDYCDFKIEENGKIKKIIRLPKKINGDGIKYCDYCPSMEQNGKYLIVTGEMNNKNWFIVCNLQNNKIIYGHNYYNEVNPQFTFENETFSYKDANGKITVSLTSCGVTSCGVSSTLRGVQMQDITPGLLKFLSLPHAKPAAIAAASFFCIYGIYRIIKSRRAKNTEQKPDPVVQEFMAPPVTI